MTDESYSFTAAKTRLDEIVTQVRKKDTSLEKSLDLLEEGVRLANVCTELIDPADWASAPGTAAVSPLAAADPDAAGSAAETGAASDLDADSPVTDGSENASGDADAVVDGAPDEAIGDVWSEDEAWADEAEDDPSDGDDGHGD